MNLTYPSLNEYIPTVWTVVLTSQSITMLSMYALQWKSSVSESQFSWGLISGKCATLQKSGEKQ